MCMYVYMCVMDIEYFLVKKNEIFYEYGVRKINWKEVSVQNDTCKVFFIRSRYWWRRAANDVDVTYL